MNRLGDELYLGETSGPTPILPGGLGVYPVPFRGGELAIEFATTTVGGDPVETEVAIYDVSGRKVKTVSKGRFASSTHSSTWNGKDENGKTSSRWRLLHPGRQQDRQPYPEARYLSLILERNE